MGTCFSSTSTLASTPTAKVVALDGSLKEYTVPVNVSSALGLSRKSCFLCSSDSLYFASRIPALASHSMLELNQIYFELPVSKLEYPLSGTDMAALAVKASRALALASRKKRRRTGVVPAVAQVICEMGCVEDPTVKSIIAKRPRSLTSRVNSVKLETIEEIVE